ncbi:MAG TPA: hypothetical protein VMW83_16065 [Spirochaetia bacterium]|nr:hypothetical protein [Spirochaetia bacterium]
MLNSTAQNWLKGFHVLFGAAWIGAGASILLLSYVKGSHGDELYAVNAAMKLLDDKIIVPAAYGSLVTGILYSWLTDWGFFKFTWVIVKWVLMVAQIVFASAWLGPWINNAAALTAAQRGMALVNPAYLHDRLLIAWFGPLQLIFLVVMVFIGLLKPWGKRGRQPA